MRIQLAALVAAVASVVACQQPTADSADTSSANESTSSGAPKLCTAIRGNGEYIVTHFASLSRIVEDYGLVDGVAGGSSGSITTFVYDSILRSPVIATGDDKAKAARVALALKSLQGYGETLVQSDEGTEIGDLATTITTLKAEMDKRGIAALISTDAAKAASELIEVLSIPEVKTLVNPEALSMLTDVSHLAFNVNEIYTSAKQLGAFSVADNRLFFRPGVLNWDGLADLFGRVGDFYAGYSGADTSAQSAWLDRCAPTTAGKSWQDISPTQCGQDFRTMVSGYRAKVRAANTPSVRLTQSIGDQSNGLKKIVSTSVLEGDAVKAWDAAEATYLSGSLPDGSIPFAPNFDDVKMGYWSSTADWQTISGSHKFQDLKSSKRSSLGDATWKTILSASPAEPGLSHFVKLPDGRMSAGGWSDLAPTLVLKDLGCERVIYVTREGDESEFATAIAKDLGMSEAQWQEMYDLGNSSGGPSSFTQSLAAADGVWCTSWNSFSDLQQQEMALDSWNAPFETHAGFSGISALTAYPNASSNVNKVGCTPGVGGTATYPQ